MRHMSDAPVGRFFHFPIEGFAVARIGIGAAAMELLNKGACAGSCPGYGDARW